MRSFIASILGLAVVAACVCEGSVTVTTPFAGIRHTHRTQQVPAPANIHILEIDLAVPGVRFLVTPPNGAAPGENTLQTTRDFLTESGAQAAVNASFFFAAPASPYVNNRGLVASQGDVYSPFGEIDPNNGSPDLVRPWPVLNVSATNVATIVDRVSGVGTEVSPAIPLYNAVSGSERILTAGKITAGTVTYGSPASAAPRTAIGYTADNRLVLVVVDGRQSGFSTGMRSDQVAALLLEYGVTDAVNWDGGGSSTMVLADPVPRVLNQPSDGSERRVGTSFAVFAGPAESRSDYHVYSDFYGGDRDTFSASLTDSASSSAGVLQTSAVQVVQGTGAGDRGWYERLTFHDDPTTTSVSENTRGWFARQLSGATGAPSENVSRPTSGSVGLWARTESAGVEVSLAVDAAGIPCRGVRRALVADGAWHLYEWNLEDARQWEGWSGGDGMLRQGTFSIDSVQFFGPNADAVVDVDEVAHNRMGSLASPYSPTPVTLEPDPGSGRLANLSVRGVAGTGSETLIVGFVVEGGSRRVLLRGIGPTLDLFGVTGCVADPQLTLYQGDTPLGTNDNWGGTPTLEAAFGRTGAFGLAPSSRDAAMLITLPAGAYSLHIRGSGATPGVALAEVYEVR